MDLRKLPAVDQVILAVEKSFHGDFGVGLVSEVAKEVVAALRRELLAGEYCQADKAQLLELAALRTAERCRTKLTPGLQKVINATGVPLHTNMGRAPLASAAIAAIVQTAAGYCDLELDLATGERGNRGGRVTELLCDLTGGEDACVVNNNAAAVFLLLNTLAAGQEVVVSRGQLVEIGGSFRIPDIMSRSGAVLREVGCTNKTHVADYENAINERTAMLLWVHQSNFRQQGFVSQTTIPELAQLAQERQLPLAVDLGSGCLYPLALPGMGEEPLVGQVLAAGAALVSISGDKLLGGPQAGILIGKRDKIKQIRENPLYRAFRPDKLTLAALSATLLLYRQGQGSQIPLIGMLTAGEEQLAASCAALSRLLEGCPGLQWRQTKTRGEIGGGSLPGVLLEGYGLQLRHDRLSAAGLGQALRRCQPPVMGYIHKDWLTLDLRTVSVGEIALIGQALQGICREETL